MVPDRAQRVALVTGSSRGIGRAIAAEFAAAGYRLAVNGRNADAVAEAAAAIPGAQGFVADVTKAEEARQLAAEVTEQFGRLDVLVCNVGSGASVPPGEETSAEWQRVFALNLWSATNMVEASFPALAEAQGSVVCISSICGQEAVAGAPVTYSAAKAALDAYVRGAARWMGERNVRINAIAPGNILFDGSVWGRRMQTEPEQVEAMLGANVPLRRLGRPEEVARLALQLAETEFATGAIWRLDGGQARA